MRRTSHALVVDGRVWLIDPVDEHRSSRNACARSASRPACCSCSTATSAAARRGRTARRAAPSRLGDARRGAVPDAAVRSRRWWKEVALWEPVSRTLVCADALGTVGYFCAPGERIGLHPLLRLFPPRALERVAPERILCGHGAGMHEDADECAARGAADGASASALVTRLREEALTDG